MTTRDPKPSRFASSRALHSALIAGDRPPRADAISATLTFTWRGILKIKHVPEQLLDVTLTPVLFTLIFTYFFGGAIAGSPGDYLQYLLPGIIVMSVLFTTVYSGVTLNTDVTKGVSDRFRSLPIWPSAPLVGSVLGDSVRYLLSATVALSLGLLLGFRPEGGLLGVMAALALLLVFAFALSWVFTTIGLLLRTPNAVMNLGFTIMFPLTFMSNVFVEPETMPPLLESWVNVNPVSLLTSSTRGLMQGKAVLGGIGLTLFAAAVCTAVFAPLTLRLYRRKT